jgi:5-methylcytosine-specific restriction enzyme subunit McrC
LQLREWTPKLVQLSAEEISELQSCGAELLIQPHRSGDYEVSATSVVGSVTTPHLRLIIEPKFEIDRLFHMLGRARRNNLLREATELGAQPDLTEGFIRLYLNMLQRRLRRGLLKGYRSEEESLQTIRGRIRISEQLSRRYALPIPIEVKYDDYTEDIPENRVLKAAVRRLAALRLESSRLRRRLAETLAAMEVVSDERFSRSSLPTFHYTRLNEPYRPVLELSALILQDLAVDLHEGAHTITALLFDMNKLFEDFIFESLRQRLGPSLETADRWDQGRTIRLDEESVLTPKPDLTWWRGRRCLFVGDAKYKLTEEGRLSDLYQLLAYCVATGLNSGLLIYAEQPTGPVQHRIVHGGPILRVAGVDVASPVPVIETRLDEIAARIRRIALAGWK